MTLANQIAQWALTSKATSTAKLGSGTTTIGTTLTQKEWTDADIVYGFEVKAAASANVATLTLSTGAIVKTTGTPDVTRWGTQTGDTAAEDFQGITIPTMVTFYGMLVETNSANDKYIALTCSDAALPDVPQMQANSVFLTALQTGGSYIGTVAFTFESHAAAAGDIVTCTVIGKST